jgi:hypothetical protein
MQTQILIGLIALPLVQNVLGENLLRENYNRRMRYL